MAAKARNFEAQLASGKESPRAAVAAKARTLEAQWSPSSCEGSVIVFGIEHMNPDSLAQGNCLELCE